MVPILAISQNWQQKKTVHHNGSPKFEEPVWDPAIINKIRYPPNNEANNRQFQWELMGPIGY